MAGYEEITSKNEPETIWLTEANISGEKLSSLMDSHMMAGLKWWLLCRGI